MDIGVILLNVLIIVIAVVGGIFTYQRAKKQVRAWRHWALARDWYFAEERSLVHKAFRGGPFDRGRSRRSDRVFSGTFDRMPVTGFRYRYDQGSSDKKVTFTYQVMAVRIPGASFPWMELKLEGWGSRTFGQDLQFEDADFNHMWNVRSSVPRFAHDVCHPRAIEFLKRGLPKFESMWFEGDCLLISSRATFKPEHVDPYLRALTDFVRYLPAFVLKEVGSGRLPLDHSGPGVSHEDQRRRLTQLEAQGG